jgi:ABC-type multidrug transport system fused ATPase/permease subunit
MKRILYQAFGLLSTKHKRNGASIIILLVLGSLLDFFSLAFFLPVILVLIQPQLIEKNLLLHEFYQGFDFLSTSQFNITLITGVFIFLVAKTLINQWITFRKASFAYAVASDLATRTADSYFARTYLEFSEIDFSKEVNRMVSAPLAFSNNIIIPAGTLLSESIVFFMIACAIAAFDVRAFLLVCLMLGPAAALYWLRKKYSSEISTKLGKHYPEVLKRGFEIAEGQVEIRSFQREQFFKQKFTTAHEELDKVLAADHAAQTGTTRITEIVGAAAISAVIIYTVATNTPSGEIVLLLGAYATASFRIIPSVNRILGSLHQIRTNAHVVEALSIVKPSNPGFETAELSFQKTIVFDKVSFHYPEQSDVLTDIFLEIRKGEKIALTGASGKGKTTLLLLLLGFLRADSGRILIDGNTLDRGSETSWRKLVGHVPQRPYILDGSIGSNIAFGDVSPDFKKIESLIQDLELDQWISTLAKGIHTEIGERGVKVSGGQLQRISLARALYRDPEILLLDEVTNQLDHATEAAILKSLIKVSAGKTLIMITHNHHVLQLFDRVLEVNAGRINEVARPFSQIK